jgi:three-Cys-motif partner protein
MARREDDTRWKQEGRTAAKHQVLVEYLGAWIPILGQLDWVHDLVLIDGFAGPGRHTGGEPGSPLLMLDAFAEHRAHERLDVEAHFFFIEKDPRRVASLRQELADRGEPPQGVTIEVIGGDYAEEFLPIVEAARERWADCPVFAFIDPFGADRDQHLTADLLSLPRCEALTFVPVGYFSDLFNVDDMRDTLRQVFGEEVFERGVGLDPTERRELLVAMTEERLRGSCKWVRAIELVPAGPQGRYHYLFFGTNHPRGLARMKSAMWKLDPVGGVSFRDSTNPGQGVMFEDEPDFGPLLVALKENFGERVFTVEEAEDFTLFETPYLHDSQLKSKVLRPAEIGGELEAVDPPPGRRKNTYKKDAGIRLRFVEPPSDDRLF